MSQKAIELKKKEDFDYSQRLGQLEQYLIHEIQKAKNEIEYSQKLIVEEHNKEDGEPLFVAITEGTAGNLNGIITMLSSIYHYAHDGAWEEIEVEVDDEQPEDNK